VWGGGWGGGEIRRKSTLNQPKFLVAVLAIPVVIPMWQYWLGNTKLKKASFKRLLQNLINGIFY